MDPVLSSALITAGGQLFSNFVQSRLARSDYNYTHNMTNIPAQVAEIREAGLNPALAYGQVTASQGQSLGNYQGDIAQGARAISQIPLVRQEVETQKAQELYYKSLAFKTNEEGLMASFQRTHQEEAWQLNKEHQGLVNLKLDNDISLVRTQVTAQEIQNEISRIDLSYHDKISEANLRRVVAETGLQIALTKTENVLRNSRLNEIRANILQLMAYRSYLSSLSSFVNQQRKNEWFVTKMNETQSLYLDWLTDDNSSFRKMNRREAWKVYGNSISQGIGAAVGAGTAVFINKGRGINQQIPNWSSYGPGRDNLGH